MVGGLVLLSGAALLAGLSIREPRWWTAAVHLAILGGLLPIIYAVNHRIVPVFSRRTWRAGSAWPMLVTLALASGVASAVGTGLGARWAWRAGAVLALAGGLLFLGQLGSLFRQPVTGPPLPLPYEGQRPADRVATWFSKMSGVYLLAGLVIGLVTSFMSPARGRWDLAWAHALLLGFVVSMATSVTYHVLPRWGQGRWRTPRLLPVHFAISAVATAFMVVALAAGSDSLFRVGGVAQAVALLLWGINCAPLLMPLPGATRAAMGLSFGFLAIGVALGATFALDRRFGPIYRQVHAEFNVFGWAGFLVLGAASFLVPRLAGRGLPWPWLARLQFPLLAIAIVAGGAARRMHNAGRGDFQGWIEGTHVAMAAVLASFALQVALAFLGTSKEDS